MVASLLRNSASSPMASMASCVGSRAVNVATSLSVAPHSLRQRRSVPSSSSRRRARSAVVARAEAASKKPASDGIPLHSVEPILKSLLCGVRRATVVGLVALEVLAPVPFQLPDSNPQLQGLDPVHVRQHAAPAPTSGAPPAHAVLLSPDTKVPRNAEVALRRAVPVVNQSLRKIQDGLEELFVLLRIPQRKPYGTMEAAVKKALTLAVAEQEALVAAVPGEQREQGQALVKAIITGEKDGLPGLLKAIGEKDADLVSLRLAASLDKVSQLAVLQAPGLPFALPAQYANLPRLTGRAVVELEVLKKDGSPFSIKNGAATTTTGKLLAVLDGYSAPLTAGNFAKNVADRAYDGVAVRTTQQAVLSDARDSASHPDLPLELLPSGDFQPVYRTPLEVSDGELPVLPMSVFGALVASHSTESESLSSASQFFVFLYDKRNSGLGGLAFDEGQFAVFGYVTEGKDILSQLRTGDVIQSARIISGADRLDIPS